MAVLPERRAYYHVLEKDVQVKLNAAILEGLANDPTGFGKAFFDEIKKNPIKDRTKAFQGVLDAVRDQLALDADIIPKVKVNDLNTAQNQTIQKTRFFEIWKMSDPTEVSKYLKSHPQAVFESDYKGGAKQYDLPTPDMPQKDLHKLHEVLRARMNIVIANSQGMRLSESGVSVNDSLVVAAALSNASGRGLV